MSNININSIKGGDNQFGDNNQQIINSSVIINEVRDVLINYIKENVSIKNKEEYIEYVNILTDEKKSERERKNAASKISDFIQPILVQLSEMGGAFLKGYTQQ